MLDWGIHGVQTMAGNAAIIDDIFEILEVDPDGKKFDKVSRYGGLGVGTEEWGWDCSLGREASPSYSPHFKLKRT